MSPPFDNTAHGQAKGAVIGIVGSAVSHELGNRSSEDRTRAANAERRAKGEFDADDEIIVSTGGEGWQSRLRVLDPLDTTLESGTLDAWASSHYGLPSYVASGQPYLFLLRDKGYGLGMDVISTDPVFSLEDGSYAVCGSRYAAEDGDAFQRPPVARPLAFADAVYLDIAAELAEWQAEADALDDRTEKQALEAEMAEWSSALDTLYPSTDFRREGDVIHCRRGIPAAEVARFEIRTRHRDTAVQERCEAQNRELNRLAYHDGAYFPDQATRKKAYTDAMQSCRDSLLASGWPYTD